MNYNNKDNLPILVIGGAGYIGSHIVLELCEKGTVFDNILNLKSLDEKLIKNYSLKIFQALD